MTTRLLTVYDGDILLLQSEAEALLDDPKPDDKPYTSIDGRAACAHCVAPEVVKPEVLMLGYDRHGPTRHAVWLCPTCAAAQDYREVPAPIAPRRK